MRLFPIKKLRPRSGFESYSDSIEYATNQRLAASAGRAALVYLAASSGIRAIDSMLDKVPATVVKPADVVVFIAEVAFAQFCHRWYQDAAHRSEETWTEYDIARKAELAVQQEQQPSPAGLDQSQAVSTQPESGNSPAPQPPDEPPTPPANS